VPPGDVVEAVDVLLELPAEPGLAHTRLPVDDQQGRAPAVLDAVEDLLDQP
jgi:hypothetical protein